MRGGPDWPPRTLTQATGGYPVIDAPWAEVQAVDIESRFRPLTDAENAVIGTMIRDAQDILEGQAEHVGITADAVVDTRLSRTYVRLVSTMVIRVLRNPDGLLQYTIDDFTARLDSVVSGGLLYVSDDELETLRPVASRRRSGAFSIRPTSPRTGYDPYLRRHW